MNDSREEQALMDSSIPSSEVMSEKEKPAKAHLAAKLVAIHIVHALLVGAHIFAVVAAFSNWSIPFLVLDISLVQTGVTAGLQVAFIVIIGGLLALAREIAGDADIRNPPTLGLLHLRLKAWSGLSSSLSANWLYIRSNSNHPGEPGLKSIMFYLASCTLLQVSSGSIFAATFDTNRSATLVDYHTPYVISGSRFGDFDSLWPSASNISSSDRFAFPPATQNAAVNMFAARTNDTRYPGLHGRLLHDTVNLDNSIDHHILWSQARVNATLVNVHCSQISDATINTFILPAKSTDMKLAEPSPRNGQERFLFRNSSSDFDFAAWINVSIPAPPYWNPGIPGLDITARWGVQTSLNLPTSVFFQPWEFRGSSDYKPIGHHQLVMVIATPYAEVVLRDSANSTGNVLNLTMYQEPNSPSSVNGRQAYIQVVGCTVKNENITATIDTKSRLMDPLTTVSKLIGPEAPHDDHAWDEFAWEDGDGVSGAEKQFLLAFTPTSAYNSTSADPRAIPIANPETVLGQLLKGNLFSPFDSQYGINNARNALVNFQGTLERLYASYLWNVNRLCSPFDDIQPYWEDCGGFWGADSLYSPANFQLLWPGYALIVVQWRAVVSLICCVMMFFLGWGLGVTPVKNHEPMGAQQATGLLDSAMVLSRGSRIPETVAAEGVSERARLNALLSKRLRYVEQDDGLGGYLDVDDSPTAK
ncbi:hypothetical protein C8R43DRAFT_1229399, partial [Mycena crocata]